VTIIQPIVEPACPTPYFSAIEAQRQINHLRQCMNDPILGLQLPVPPGAEPTEPSYLSTYLERLGEQILFFTSRVKRSLVQLSELLVTPTTPFRVRISAFKRIAALKPLKLPKRIARSNQSLPYRELIAAINRFMADCIHNTCEYLRHLADSRNELNLYQTTEVYYLLTRITPFHFTFDDLSTNAVPIELQDPPPPKRQRAAAKPKPQPEPALEREPDPAATAPQTADSTPETPSHPLIPGGNLSANSQNRHSQTAPSLSSFGNLAVLQLDHSGPLAR